MVNELGDDLPTPPLRYFPQVGKLGVDRLSVRRNPTIYRYPQGAEGDPCDQNNDCGTGLKCINGTQCYDGTVGDPCGNNGDCDNFCVMDVCT